MWFKNNKVESLKHQIIILSFERKHLIYKKEKYFTNSSRICLFTSSLLKKITFTRNDEWIYFRPWIYFFAKTFANKKLLCAILDQAYLQLYTPVKIQRLLWIIYTLHCSVFHYWILLFDIKVWICFRLFSCWFYNDTSSIFTLSPQL